MIKILSLFMLSLIMAACATPFSKLTPAEKESGYTYIPIDPFSVETTRGEGCKVPKKTSQKNVQNVQSVQNLFTKIYLNRCQIMQFECQ